MIYIVAGDGRQAITFARDVLRLKPEDFRIIRNDFDLQGRRGVTVMCFGTFACRSDWAKIYGIMKCLDCKILYIEVD